MSVIRTEVDAEAMEDLATDVETLADRMVELIDVLRAFRKLEEMSRADVSNLIGEGGLTEAQLAGVEQGTRPLSIAEALQVSRMLADWAKSRAAASDG